MGGLWIRVGGLSRLVPLQLLKSGVAGVQVISTDLNYATLELLQLLLSWQERAKAANPLQASGHKRVVSGLRCARRLLTLPQTSSGVGSGQNTSHHPAAGVRAERIVSGMRCACRLFCAEG